MVILKQMKYLSVVASMELEDDEEVSDETKNDLAKLFNVYELLISEAFSLGPHEDFDRNKLPRNTKRELSDIHEKYFKKSFKSTFIGKCALSQDASEENLKNLHDLAGQVFDDLIAIKEIEAIVKVVTESEDLKILLDLKHDSVEHMDPTANENVDGKTYFKSGKILIGAKGLLTGGEARYTNLGFVTMPCN